MSLDTPTVEHPIAPPKPRGGMFALSLLYLLLEISYFWDRHTAPATVGIIFLVCVTSLAAFQFASRTFDPIRAAARTARIGVLSRDRLLRGNKILRMTAAVAVIVISTAYFVSSRHLFRGWMIYLYPPVFLWPMAIGDLVGEDPTPRPRSTVGPRIDWTNLKPIHSDHWGQRV